ncbi:hypothetical protein GCM10017783_08620 [Deinococcus piscis]|uniref:Uncharacterized protein n=1 Tax=Deinococcus piscis TaxID=394230 RepID=A0ABQ3K200_9DEIO|nr:hypothetical protein [Deinococcus piscis]GHF98883.1 hypothetical protein GCM10017783_08620 [Deinococcus piscis]
MTLHPAAHASSPLTEHLVTALRQLGLHADWLEEGALVEVGDHRIVLDVARGGEGEVLVRANMPLDIFVEEDSLPDSLMGLNLMNQTLDFGMLVLDPVEEESGDEDMPATFAIVGRTVVWLSSTGPDEAQRLATHLHRFEAEIFNSLESAVNSAGAMTA